jgi:hypothetical protein
LEITVGARIIVVGEAQLSVGKGGKKLIPFLIFKGEFETIC